MIGVQFFVSRGHEYTVRALASDLVRLPVRVVDYGSAFRAVRLPAAATVFTDIDRLAVWEREWAAGICQKLREAGVPVFNDPARVLTRQSLLRALFVEGINGFNAYRADERVEPLRWPVFLRRNTGHGRPLSGLLPDRAALDDAIEGALRVGVPLENQIIVEYAAEPFKPGGFRKWATFLVGGRIVPHLPVHDDHWLVKYGKVGIADEADYAEESSVFVRHPHEEILRRAFAVAGIDYGRADYGIVGGKVQIYEINTAPDIKRLDKHPSPIRVADGERFWSGLISAVADLTRGRPKGGYVSMGRRGWRVRFGKLVPPKSGRVP